MNPAESHHADMSDQAVRLKLRSHVCFPTVNESSETDVFVCRLPHEVKTEESEEETHPIQGGSECQTHTDSQEVA